VVQSARGDEPLYLDTAFTFQAARGAVLWLMCCGLAPLAAWFYRDSRLALLLPVAGLTVLLGGFESMALAKLQRQLRVGWLIATELLDVAVTVVVMLAWARVAPSVWALVWGGVFGGIARVALSHSLDRSRRDRFAWERRSLREVVGIGKWLFASTLLTFVAGQSDRLVFARMLDLGMLGVYSIAATLASPLIILVARVSRTVVFPSLGAKARISEEAFRDAFDRTMRAALPFAGAVVSGLVAVGPSLIALLYDQRYQAAGWIVQLLALGGWLYALGASGGEALLARGHARWLALANGAKALAIPFGIWLGFEAGGFVGAVLGFACSELARYATFAVGRHALGLRPLRTELALSARTAAAAALGTLAAGAARQHGGALAGTAAGGAVAVAFWLPSLWGIYTREFARGRFAA
jgi:O-antigen/teichoic acid export membrane protein